jgi:hypothetical protein
MAGPWRDAGQRPREDIPQGSVHRGHHSCAQLRASHHVLHSRRRKLFAVPERLLR